MPSDLYQSKTKRQKIQVQVLLDYRTNSETFTSNFENDITPNSTEVNIISRPFLKYGVIAAVPFFFLLFDEYCNNIPYLLCCHVEQNGIDTESSGRVCGLPKETCAEPLHGSRQEEVRA